MTNREVLKWIGHEIAILRYRRATEATMKRINMLTNMYEYMLALIHDR